MADIANPEPSLPRPKAYSYLRFSTPDQIKGDSFRRQNDAANAYALAEGLDLDQELTFHDLGVSGFRGRNAEAGRLADFLEAVETGLVPPGSILLVEQLDRLSRLVPRKAIRVLERIMEADITVVTLKDRRRYDLESIDKDHVSFMLAILTFMRANEESESKSHRLKQSWGAKRADVANRPLTSKAPAWLRLDRDAGQFVPLPDRAAVVKRIYALTLEGAGQHKIAETFNREGMETWGRGQHWQRSYIAKVLANPAVIGTLTPHFMEHVGSRKSRKPLEPVLNYYPSVISPETFADVQALQASQGAPSRGRHAHHPVSNILAGLAKCPKCGKTMTRVQKGKRSKPSFVCTAAKAGSPGCAYKSVPYQQVEDRIVLVLPGMLEDREGAAVSGDLEQEIFNAEEYLDALREEVGNLLENLEGQRSKALTARLLVKEAEVETVQGVLQDLQERRDMASGPVIGSRIAKAVQALQPPEGPLDRAVANLALRSLFRKAVINWPEAAIDLEWTNGGTCRVVYGWAGKPHRDS